MNTLYVGIDVSSKSNVVYLMLPNGDKHSNFSVANSHEGSTQLVKRILSALTSHSLDTVLIGLEAVSYTHLTPPPNFAAPHPEHCILQFGVTCAFIALSHSFFRKFLVCLLYTSRCV